MSIFLSKILNNELTDQKGRPLGKLNDMLVESGDGYLRITGLVLKRKRKKQSTTVPLVYAGLGVVVGGRLDELNFQDVPEDTILLSRDILDAQVIDINGAKVIRVNDIQLDQVDGRWIVSGLDIGAWGLCRRLGIANWLRIAAQTFRFTVPEGIIPWKEVAPLNAGFHSLQLQVSSDQIERLHPADLADIVEELGHRERQQLLAKLTVEQTADLVEESDPSMQLAILTDLGEELAADVLEAMEPDDAADLLQDVPAEDRDAYLGKMEPDEAEELRRLMQWEEGTAGALMNTSYWSLPAHMTRSEALAYLRSGIDLCEEVLHIYVLDAEEHFVGVLHLRKLMVAEDDAPIVSLLEDDPEWVGPEESVATIKRQMVRYQLLAMPVLDADKRLLGVVTIYDLLEMLFDD